MSKKKKKKKNIAERPLLTCSKSNYDILDIIQIDVVFMTLGSCQEFCRVVKEIVVVAAGPLSLHSA